MVTPPWRLKLPPSAKANDDKWLEHLNALYSQEYTLLNLAVSVGVVAAPLLAAFTINLPQTCVKHATPQRSSCVNTSELLAIPLGPVLLLLFLGFLFFNSRTVGKYTRFLERTLSGDSEATDAETAEHAIHYPALSRVNGALYGGETARLRPLRVFYQAMGITIVVTSILTVVSVLDRVPNIGVRVVAYVFYSGVALFFLAVYTAGARHRNFVYLLDAVHARDVAESHDPAPEGVHMGWVAFAFRVLLPRPLSVGKGQDALIVIGLVLLLEWDWPGRAHFWWTVLAVVIFELVLYQTRYLLNGIREVQVPGFNLPADRRNQSALPYAPGQQVGALFFAVGRLALFAALITFLPTVSRDVMWLTLALFVVSYYLYEVPREIARLAFIEATRDDEAREGTETASGPEIGRAQKLVAALANHRWLPWFMFVAVGAGYALRVAFVLYLWSATLAESVTGVLIILAVWAAASAAVAAGWAVEFTGAVSLRAGQAPRLHPSLVTKPQLVWAAGFVRGEPGTGSLFPTAEPDFVEFKADESLMKKQKLKLWHFTRTRLAPWRIAALLGVALWLCVALIRGPWWLAVVTAALFAGLVAAVLGRGHRTVDRDEVDEANALLADGYSPSVTGTVPDVDTRLVSSWQLGWPFLVATAAIASVASLGTSWQRGGAVVLGATWTMLRVGGSENGSLAGFVERAQMIQDWIDDNLTDKLKEVGGMIVTLLVGSGVVDAVRNRPGDFVSRDHEPDTPDQTPNGEPPGPMT